MKDRAFREVIAIRHEYLNIVADFRLEPIAQTRINLDFDFAQNLAFNPRYEHTHHGAAIQNTNTSAAATTLESGAPRPSHGPNAGGLRIICKRSGVFVQGGCGPIVCFSSAAYVITWWLFSGLRR